ncbi:HNH endonuclease family protein [Cognaticolwellia mytili]|uniref:HNH endonuclease n=1 Tax=Cognaticolwellia mytili TaxID=1888913 RepID=UPI000A16EDFC|nr:HNH endonuclease [Cognaticolwellia mytili]
MIKLQRPKKPNILVLNEYSWLCKLQAAIAAYGSYKKIPKEQKDKLISHYRHQEIKTPLFESSSQKCAFCECMPAEGGHIEVEHFKPKSIHPNSTFEWINFLPSCRKCNGYKLDHDTVKEPIINPYETDPEEVFDYEAFRINAKKGPHEIAGNKTIAICGLNSAGLMQPRANILVSLFSFSDSLELAITDYHEASTDIKKRNRVRNINQAIERIELLVDPGEKYSGFCKDFLKKCETYQKAKEIVEQVAA